MAYERYVRAYLTHTTRPSVEGVLEYIDAYDKSLPSLAELNEALCSAKDNTLFPVARDAYNNAIKQNREKMLAFLEKRGVSRKKVKAVLASSSKPPDLTKARK